MEYAASKMELIQKILATENKNLISHLKAIFLTQEDDWWETLPPKIKASVERGLKQSAEGNTTPHKDVMKKYKKWLK
jgi:hypothetical protein